MKHVVSAVIFLALGAGTALAQGDRRQDLEKLEKKFEDSMKRLEENFKKERAALEKEFKAAKEKLLGPKTPTPHRFRRMPGKQGEEFRNMEELLKQVLERARRGFEDGRRFPNLPQAAPRGLEKKLDDVLKRLERLEKRFEGEGRKPSFRQFRWQGPKEFEFDFDFKDFKDFERFLPRDEREWREWMPKFRYKFRRESEDRDGDKDY